MTQIPVDPLVAPFNNAHDNSDTDLNLDSIHHTLGPAPTQGAPGNHSIHYGTKVVESTSTGTGTITDATETAFSGLTPLVIDVPQTPSGAMRFDIYIGVNWFATAAGSVQVDFIIRDGGSSAPTNASTFIDKQPDTGAGASLPQFMTFITSVLLTSGRHELGLFTKRISGTSNYNTGSTTYTSRMRATPVGFI